ncbi:GNAT family protein [Flammeovirga sp. SubArs3]|uniref:GNAT family N-acetyltransferase n=1 Tax=Flammeovirga sp. SubArs3 TaxID=2995316 RepID=UPI00248C10B3|nr:GNAT family protein [Flammeovirga sp. SubArs3]
MISLRKLQKEDRTIIVELINNRKILDNLRDRIPYPYSLSDADFFIDLTHKEEQQNTFAITYNGDFCGVIGLIRLEDIHRLNAEIGYWIGEKYWNKGIITEAIEQVTQYGFETLQLERIFAGVFDYNKGSMKALEKNGFQLEGIHRRAIVKNDVIYDEHLYAKLKEY